MRTNFTFSFLLILLLSLYSATAQTTYNVPTLTALNEFIADNYDSTGVSTYVLEREGYYPLSGSIGFSGDIAIIAQEGQGMRPIIIMGINDDDDANGWGLMFTDGSVTFKSLRLNISNGKGGRGPWTNAGVFTSGSNITIEFDDCIVDYADGVAISNESGTGVELILTNNLFRWNGTNNGGIFQGFGTMLKNGSLESAFIENNTFVECIAPIFVHENGHLKKFWFNHNTIVSHAQFPIRAEYWDQAVFMNNLFVDAHFGGETKTLRAGQDPEGLPYGIVNIASYSNDTLVPETYPAESERVVAMAYNANYVSDEIKSFWENASDYFADSLDYQVADYTKGDNGFLNSRTYNMMNDETNYPYFEWDEELSVFTGDPEFKGYDLKTTEEILIARLMNGDATVSLQTTNGNWGMYPGPEDENAAYPVERDYWDFAYNNAAYAKAGYQGYPLGDLNWWPEKKETWENDANRENLDDIVAAIKGGTFEFIDWTTKTNVSSFTKNNFSGKIYPNPTTGVVNFAVELKSPEDVSLKVYNMFGQEVRVLLHKQSLSAGTHKKSVDLSDLPAGTYFYKLQVGDQAKTEKIVVL
jgi:hypothetical protein